ncbi:MAG TPA: translation initiation factor IF-2, partial [Devosia sp.]|nr:translation initiation factor IF-2 [Devosia sp.]
MADSDDKTTTGGKKTLTLKGGPALGARPGMSRGGRSTVVVEKRTRVVPRGNAGVPAHTPATAQPQTPPAPRSVPPRDGARPQLRTTTPPPRPGGALSSTEAEARQRALREAGARQADDTRRAQEAEARRAEEDARRREIREAAAREDAARAARAAEAAAGDVALEEAPPAVAPRPSAPPRRPAADNRPAARR